MNRPPHVQRAIDALMDSTARAGQVPFGDCCELSHYVARLEREATAAKAELAQVKAGCTLLRRIVDRWRS